VTAERDPLERVREAKAAQAESRLPGPVITDATRRQLVDGGQFIIDSPKDVPAVFGKGQEVCWAQGESLIIVGPTGVGKGTLLQQIALRRMGILAGELLEYAVTEDADRLTVYLAMDRPSQIMRSFKRMVTDDQAGLLRQRMRVWKGALPFDIVKHPELLVEFVLEIGQLAERPVGTLIADSIKDLGSKLSSDETGGALNRAFGLVLAADIELAASHHQRKATAENKKPKSLDDVYGSTWITAGAGSVVLLWGEPGDTTVELSHLKPPADPLGPFDIEHDHDAGVSTRPHRADVWSILQAATDGGITVADATRKIYGARPEKRQTQAVRRKLDRLVTDERAVRVEASEKFEEVRYRPVPRQMSVTERAGVVTGTRDGERTEHAQHETPGNTEHAPSTHPDPLPPYVVGGGERAHDDDLDHLPATVHREVAG
jgi:hypothetical protein